MSVGVGGKGGSEGGSEMRVGVGVSEQDCYVFRVERKPLCRSPSKCKEDVASGGRSVDGSRGGIWSGSRGPVGVR